MVFATQKERINYAEEGFILARLHEISIHNETKKKANISSGEMNGIKICQNKGHINGKITENLIEKNKNLIHNKL